MFRATGLKLFIFQLIALSSIPLMILYATPLQWLIGLVIYVISVTLGITVTYHRLLSHRSWKCLLWVEYLLTFLATFAISGSSIGWVAIHRKHHRYSDLPKDPHSPKYKNIFQIYAVVLFENPEVKYATDLIRDKFHKWQHEYYFAIILIYATILYVISPMTVVYVLLFPAALMWLAQTMINYFSHVHGPNNNLLLSILTGGEGYHLNHHENPNEYKFGKVDLGRLTIKLLKND